VPESDGTIAWDRTTIVIVEPEAGGIRGLGYSSADPTVSRLIADNFSPIVLGRNAFDIGAIWSSLVGAVRNVGRPGIATAV
jgi:L-alanine-DL-glutamate epimerase-like enolase superfamily enzyme